MLIFHQKTHSETQRTHTESSTKTHSLIWTPPQKRKTTTKKHMLNLPPKDSETQRTHTKSATKTPPWVWPPPPPPPPKKTYWIFHQKTHPDYWNPKNTCWICHQKTYPEYWNSKNAHWITIFQAQLAKKANGNAAEPVAYLMLPCRGTWARSRSWGVLGTCPARSAPGSASAWSSCPQTWCPPTAHTKQLNIKQHEGWEGQQTKGPLRGWGSQRPGAAWKSRWPSWAPIPNKPTVSVHVKKYTTNVGQSHVCMNVLGLGGGGGGGLSCILQKRLWWQGIT